jgi:starch synthase
MAKTPSGKKSAKKIVPPASKKSAAGGKPAAVPPVAKKANPVKATLAPTKPAAPFVPPTGVSKNAASSVEKLKQAAAGMSSPNLAKPAVAAAAKPSAPPAKAPQSALAKPAGAPLPVVVKPAAEPAPAKPVITSIPSVNTPAAKEIAAPVRTVVNAVKVSTPRPVMPMARPSGGMPVPFIPVAKPSAPILAAQPSAPVAKSRQGRAPKINLASPASATTKRTPVKTTSRAVPAAPAKTSLPRRILFIASECTPMAQTGGLGDVVAGLSKALVQRGHDVRIIMPLYGSIDRARFGVTFQRSCCVHFGNGEEIWIGLYEGMLDNEVPVWFVDYERYFGRPWLYDGSDEDGFRFGVLSKAALQACKDTGYIPHVVHLHDWMSAPVAVFLKTWDRVLSPLSKTGSVLTLHNIGYQGKFHRSVLDFYGLGQEFLTPDRFEDFGAANLLKAGIQYADMITTVSPTYAREIREPIGGMGMGLYLNDRVDRVVGILNGVDTELWDPRTDKYLPARYSADDLAGKAACKRALQERLGLEVNPKIPIFGMISRFAPQKGFDLIRGALPQAMRDMVMQAVALGAGDPVTENFFRWLQGAFPGRAHATIGFDPGLAHLIEAGSDFFLMPSYYEPCGLNQMYSSLYGALPIVRATGGLDDTVENYSEAAGTGTGFKFWDATDRALFFTIGWAVSTWFDRPHHYAALQQAGMRKDFSWTSSAREYEDVYERAIACHA